MSETRSKTTALISVVIAALLMVSLAMLGGWTVPEDGELEEPPRIHVDLLSATQDPCTMDDVGWQSETLQPVCLEFHEYDLDGDGDISGTEELEACDCAESDFNEYSEDGKISYLEFLTPEKMFTAFDSDGDGYLQDEELEECGGQDWDHCPVLDGDGDGALSEAEYTAFAQFDLNDDGWLASKTYTGSSDDSEAEWCECSELDTNEDGFVSAPEFMIGQDSTRSSDEEPTPPETPLSVDQTPDELVEQLADQPEDQPADETEDQPEDQPAEVSWEDYDWVEADPVGLYAAPTMGAYVPIQWGDEQGEADGSPTGEFPASIVASADLQAWRANYVEEPGVFMGWSPSLFRQYTPEEFLDLPSNNFSGECEYVGRKPYEDDFEDGKFTGVADYYQNCGANGTELVVTAATPIEGQEILVVHQITTAENHDEVRKRIIGSTIVYENGVAIVVNGYYPTQERTPENPDAREPQAEEVGDTVDQQAAPEEDQGQQQTASQTAGQQAAEQDQGQEEKADQQAQNSTGGGLSGTYGCLSLSDGYADPSSGVPPSGTSTRFTVKPDGTWSDITFGELKAQEGSYTVSGNKAQFNSAEGTPVYNFEILEGGARLLDEANRQNCRK